MICAAKRSNGRTLIEEMTTESSLEKKEKSTGKLAIREILIDHTVIKNIVKFAELL